MPISEAENRALARRLAAIPPERASDLGILPRLAENAPERRLVEPARSPVQMVLRSQQNVVNSDVLGPLVGPVIIHQVTVRFSETVALATAVALLRLDFSSNSVLDAFTNVAGDYPTGQSTADWTLFRDVASRSEFLTAARRFGWWWINPGGSTTTEYLFEDLRFEVPLDTVFLKLYVNKQTAVDAVCSVNLSVSQNVPREALAGGWAGPPMRSPLVVTPREPRVSA